VIAAAETRPPITSPRAIEYVRPYLYAKQAQFLFAPERYSIVEASTKTGKTVGCMTWLFEQAALGGGEGRNYWWIAPTRDVAKIAYRRLKRAIPRELYTANGSELTITLINGAVIWFKGSDRPDSLYGEDVYAAVIDEATRCKEEAWIAVRSTLTATRGPVRIIGNVKGRKNWAYKLARLAQAGTKDMAYFKLTAYDAVEGGVLSLEEVEDAKRLLAPSVFNELYLAEPSEDGSNPFGLPAIAQCFTIAASEIVAIQDGWSTAGIPCWWGIDLAKHVDWTVLIALDANGRMCRLIRFQKPWRETIAEIRRIVGRTPALMDSTGVGDPVLEFLQDGDIEAPRRPPPEVEMGASSAARLQAHFAREEAERLEKKRDLGQLTTSCPNLRGLVYSANSKQRLMKVLQLSLQHRELALYGEVVKNELESFEYEYRPKTGNVRYSAPTGLHDDCVNALALGVECRQTVARTRTGAPKLIPM
jgi:hypothetical protein